MKLRIGERVFTLLEQKGHTQSELAAFLSTSRSTINGWKKENRNPSSELIVPICEFLGVSVEFLLTGKESLNSPPSADHYLTFVGSAAVEAYQAGLFVSEYGSIFKRIREARQLADVPAIELQKHAGILPGWLEQAEAEPTTYEESNDLLHQLMLEQYAALARLLGIDLYWLFTGKVRPPAAVIHHGKLVYPPYDFMIKIEEGRPDTTQPANSKLSSSQGGTDESEIA